MSFDSTGSEDSQSSAQTITELSGLPTNGSYQPVFATLPAPNFSLNTLGSAKDSHPVVGSQIRPVEEYQKPSTGSRNPSSISTLPPQLLHLLKESFSLLDRDSDGFITPSDISAMHSQLSVSSSEPFNIRSYIPPPSGAEQKVSLPQYLSIISTLHSPIHPAPSLLSAFSAFDPDDSGQIDLEELSDAISSRPGAKAGLRTNEIAQVTEGFKGRRMFQKRGMGAGGLGGVKGVGVDVSERGHGDVFKYREFVANVSGTGGGHAVRRTGDGSTSWMAARP